MPRRGPERLRRELGKAVALGRRPEQPRSRQAERSADERIHNTQPSQVPITSAHLGEQHERRRQEYRVDEIIHAQKRDAHDGQHEDHKQQPARVVNQRDQAGGNERAGDGSEHTLQAFDQRRARPRLEDDDRGDGHPVAAREMKHPRHEYGDRRDDGDA